MMRRASTWLALLVLSVCIAGVGAAYALLASVPGAGLEPLVLLSSFLAFPVVGALIISRRPGNTVGWIFCAIGLGTAATSFSAGYMQHALATHAEAQLATGIVAILGNIVWPLNIGLGSLLIFLFPDGKLPSRRWRPVFWLDVVTIAVCSLASAFIPGPIDGHGPIVNPIGIPGAGSLLLSVFSVGQALIVPLVLASVASLIVRYRRAEGMQRQRIKWFVYGAAMLVLLIVASFTLSDALTPSGEDSSNSVISNTGFAIAIVMLPLGAGIGVLRYRLYDIDILINRTLVYASLTAVLAAVYFACVIGAQAVTEKLTGQTQPQPVIVVASTLLIAALFTPLRRRIQGAIDRRFYRQKYDEAKTLAAFSATLRSEVELAELQAHLLDVIARTMHPEHISMWLSPEAPTRSPAGSEQQSGVEQSDGGVA